MPKPRTARHVIRRQARHLAKLHVTTALANLIAHPPTPLPNAEALAAYRNQVQSYMPRVRAHVPVAAPADGRDADEAASPPTSED